MTYLDTLFAVNGKTALITGGATGIGRMAAEALVHAGARVLIASRKAPACETAADELNALGAPGSAEGFAGDVSTEEGADALAQAVRDRTDTLSILVNNAGAAWGAPIEKFPWSGWQKLMSVNVIGLFALTRNLLPQLETAATPEDPARVINLGSVMGAVPIGKNNYAYASSKAAVHHLTKVLANELAPRHITVNAFAPGPFMSKMMAFTLEDEKMREMVAKTVPAGRIGKSEDIAGALLFLCGTGGSYTTGAIIPLDGGIATVAGQEPFAD